MNMKWRRRVNVLAALVVLALILAPGQMSARGLRKVSSGPDVYVSYNAEDEHVRMDTTHIDYGFGDGWYWGGGIGMRASTTQVRTVVADMFRRYQPK